MRRRTLALAVLVAGCGGRTHPGGRDRARSDDGRSCAPGAQAVGCPCDVLEPVVCFYGEPVRFGTGACRGGLRSCVGGAWTTCEGQVLPTPEVCDGIDDDCDGEVDEGVLSECGNCDPDCGTLWFGAGDGRTPFDLDAGWCIDGTVDGGLTLEPPWGPPPRIWIPNTDEGTVSAVDTRTREEIGRYRAGNGGADDAPSRTSVDWESSVAVANRAPGGQSTVVRIFADDCPDADGDGAVETSAGRGDVLPFGDDECLAWTADVGGPDALANAVVTELRAGLDGLVEERVWVGLANERRLVELDFADGRETGVTLDVDPCRPFGAAIDRDGAIWVSCNDSTLVKFDGASADDFETLVAPGTIRGITVDENGRIWTGGDVARYDAEDGEWARVPGTSGYGIVSDGADGVWIGECLRGGVSVGTCRVDGDTLVVDEVDARSRAVATDWDGWVWGIPSSGIVDVVDPETLEVDETVLDDCDGPDGACLVGPDAFSDMIGYQLRYDADCPGTWSVVVPGCPDGGDPTWVGLDWIVDAPGASRVDFMVRSAASAESLARARFTPVARVPSDAGPVRFAEVAGVDVSGAMLEVQVTLQSFDRESLPVLTALGVERSCR